MEESGESKSVSKVTKFFDSVNVTVVLVILCMAFSAVAGTTPAPPGFKILALLFPLILVIAYIINRLFATPRRLIVCQMLLAGFWLGWLSFAILIFLFLYLPRLTSP